MNLRPSAKLVRLSIWTPHYFKRLNFRHRISSPPNLVPVSMLSTPAERFCSLASAGSLPRLPSWESCRWRYAHEEISRNLCSKKFFQKKWKNVPKILQDNPNLQVYALPLLLACIFAYLIAHCFLTVSEVIFHFWTTKSFHPKLCFLQMVIDTLFLCYCGKNGACFVDVAGPTFGDSALNVT